MSKTASSLADAISEKEFAQQVVDLARLRGWLVYRTWNSMHSPAGFPDLVMLRRRRVIFAELKSAKGKLCEKQELWLDGLVLAGQEAYCWKPTEWDSIEATLS